MERVANNKNLNKNLDEIAEKLKNGGKYEDLSEEIDRLLGTGMVERDSEVEGIFEHNKEE